MQRKDTCGVARHKIDRETRMFFFFSNRLGWLGSILISVVLTLIVLAVIGVF